VSKITLFYHHYDSNGDPVVETCRSIPTSGRENNIYVEKMLFMK
jgi:hypothetical protein